MSEFDILPEEPSSFSFEEYFALEAKRDTKRNISTKNIALVTPSLGCKLKESALLLSQIMLLKAEKRGGGKKAGPKMSHAL